MYYGEIRWIDVTWVRDRFLLRLCLAASEP
jgi:hypothetical protein